MLQSETSEIGGMTVALPPELWGATGTEVPF